MPTAIVPLRRVVLPGEQLSIHLRPEHRLRGSGPGGGEFPVVWIRGVDGRGCPECASVGTLVSVLGMRELDAGRAIARVQARERVAIEFTGPKSPHPRGRFRVLADEAGGGDGARRDAAAAAALRYLAARAEWGAEGSITTGIPSEPSPASYRVASLMELSHPERQDLLEAELSARLERVTMLLERETDLLTRTMGR